MQILRPSPCPLPEGEGESSSISNYSQLHRRAYSYFRLCYACRGYDDDPGFFFCRSNSFMKAASRSATYALYPAGSIKRSEERRVGKECRSRWSPYHLKK